MTKSSLWLTMLMALIWGTSFPVSKIAINVIGPYAFRMAGSLDSTKVSVKALRHLILMNF
jgi:hypothetical protein